MTVPGRSEHAQLIRELVTRSWIHGWLTASRELAEARRRTVAEFADPPELEWSGPVPQAAIDWLQKREVLLGKWNRDLDDKVTQILVEGLETGASHLRVMEALSELFPTFTSRRLENIARTESSAALTQGRLARFRAPDSGVVAVQFVAILDARTTHICRSRDGLIMRLDDPELGANTPPLHFYCRSTLVAVSDIDWEDLEAGDPDIEQRWFGWLEEPDAPRNLKEALAGWKKAAPPLDGFGGLVSKSSTKSRPPKKTKARKTKASSRTKSGPNPLREWIVARKKLGIDDHDEVREVGRRVLSDVRSVISDAQPELERRVRKAKKARAKASKQADIAGLVLKEAKASHRAGEVAESVVDEARAASRAARAKSKRTQTNHENLRLELASAQSDALRDVLTGVREFGGVQQRWVKRSSSKTKDAVALASQLLPSDWLRHSRKYGPIKGRLGPRGEYGHPVVKGGEAHLLTRSRSTPAERLRTALHEMGHRMELTMPELEKVAKAYLRSRTKGERLQRLSKLLKNSRYGRNEKARPDKFLHPYFGKEYKEGTEIISMGLESVLLMSYDVWEEDQSLLEFIVGVLAAL